MQIEALGDEDWSGFLELATVEGWLVPGGERALFRNGWSRHMFVLRAAGRVRGYVSAVPHQASGWIGNLIVAVDSRNAGYGSRLFDFAVERLVAAGCRDTWLTASAMGRPLYEKRGFRSLDRVTRWVYRREACPEDSRSPLTDELERLCRQDQEAWQDSRRELIRLLARGGRVVGRNCALALLQAGTGQRVLGPWVSGHGSAEEHRSLLRQAAGLLKEGDELVCDVLQSAAMASLLEEAGFKKRGDNELMVRSRRAEISLAGVVGLASLGSIG